MWSAAFEVKDIIQDRYLGLACELRAKQAALNNHFAQHVNVICGRLFKHCNTLGIVKPSIQEKFSIML